MTITVTSPNGGFIIGPGAVIQAASDLLALANPPYHWGFRFTDNDNTVAWTQTSVVTQNVSSTQIIVDWQANDVPALLLLNNHPQEGAQMVVTTTVTDDQGATIDGPLPLPTVWQPTTWLHKDMFHWAQYLKSQLSGGDPDDRIGQILAAVYRTWDP